MVSLDLTRPLCDLTLVGVTGRRVAAGPDGHRAAAAGLAAGAALLASEQLGLAQWCLDTTVEHVRTRHQFGRPVGSFQALRHRLADLWVELAQARAVARYAAACVAVDHPDTPVAAAVAQAFCGPVAVRAAEECVQLHGGIGFTWEHPAHLYLKRAKSAAIGFGTADRHRAALATLVDLPG
jgi:alkylation response protein AidB-like acyl-CoA dehydrogenase